MALCQTDKEKANIKELIEISAPLMHKILEAIEDELEDLDRVDWADFKNPSWAYERAAKDGYKKGLTKLKEYVIM